MLVQHQLTELPVTAAIAVTATQLQKIHKDPFDRLMIATAIDQKLTILTSDKDMKQYPGVKTLW